MAKIKKDKLTRNDLEKPTQRPKDRTIRILQKARDELVCSGRVSSSCSTNRTRRIIIKPHQHHVIIQRGSDTSFTNLWSLLLYIQSLLHYIENAQENKKNTI
jgi:hypothetical protein